jgi:dTMP kinase
MKYICITGADGTGKSTLIDKLKEGFEQGYVAGIWDIFTQHTNGQPFKSKQDIDTYLCALTPNARLLFLTHALSFSTQKATESNAKLILLNGYFYKYFASEAALGADKTLINNLSEYFPKPDLILNLTVNLNIAAHRKKHLSRYECGCADTATVENFMGFQEKVIENWSFFGSENIKTINTEQSENEVFEAAKILINRH